MHRVEAAQVPNPIQQTAASPHCFCVALHGEVLDPAHGPCLEHEARNPMPEHEVPEIWERCSRDDDAFLGSMVPDVQRKVHQRAQTGENTGAIPWQRDDLDLQAPEVVQLGDPAASLDSEEGESQHV